MSKRQEALDAILNGLQPDAAKPPAPAAPASSPSVVGRAARDVAQGARDLVPSVWRGVTGAITEAATSVNNLVGDPIGKLADSHPEFTKWYMKTFDGSSQPEKSTSTTGQLIEGATQFGVGMVGVGKLFKLARIPEAVDVGGKIVEAAVKGGLTDMTVFDSYGNRLSNLIQEHPALQNPVTEFLASKPEDGKAVSKLKQGLEGVVSGLAFESLFQGLKILKKSRLLSDPAVPQDVAEAELRKQLAESDAILNSAEKTARFKTIVQEDGSFNIKDTKSGDMHPVKFATQEEANAEAGTLNMLSTEQARTQAPGKLKPEQIEALKTEANRLANSTDPEDVKKLLEGTDFNFLRVSNEEEAKTWIEAISKVFRKQIDAARGGDVITHKKLLQQVSDLFPDGDPNAIIGELSKSYDNIGDLSATVTASRVLMYNLGRRVSQLSALADGDPSNALHMARMGDALDSLFYVAARLKGVTTGTARTLESMSLDVKDIADSVTSLKNTVPKGVTETATSALGKEAQKAGAESFAARKILASLEGMTPEQMRTLARRLRMADGDPAAMLAIAKSAAPKEAVAQSAGKAAINVHNEYWINSLLSGPKTNIVNTAANLSVAFLRPVETFFSGVISGNKQLRDEGVDTLIGNFLSMRDSWAGASKALRTGANVLDPDFPTNEGQAVHAIGGYLGQLVRLPSRLLMSEDEFFKQMAYRSNVRASLLRDARSQGLTGEAFGKYISDGIDAAFLPNGSGANRIGMDYAREVTFTTPLPKGTVSNWLQTGTTNHPLLKVILPFVRTPTNIIDWTWERTPLLASFNKKVREDLAAGGSRAALAQAKLGTGMTLWSTAATLAATGVITGKGPFDPTIRKQWLQSNQPYSVKIGDKWFEYKRVDPIMAPLGVAADMVAASGELKGEDITDIATAFASAVASNVTSKTYLAGISNAMEAFTSGSPTKMQDFLQNQAGTYVPNLLNQINPDDSMREVRGYVDTVFARLPGMSETLPARRNLFGEPVMKAPGELNRALNPFTLAGKPKGDGVVETKLLEIGKAMPMPSTTAPGTEELGPGVKVDMSSRNYGTKGDLTPYDRMLELTANPGKGQPSLRDALTKLVMSPQWDNLSAGADVAPGGIKYNLASQLIQGYRQRAYLQVQQEFPLLRRAILTAQATKKVAVTQGNAGVQRIQDLLKQKAKP